MGAVVGGLTTANSLVVIVVVDRPLDSALKVLGLDSGLFWV